MNKISIFLKATFFYIKYIFTTTLSGTVGVVGVVCGERDV